MAIGKELAYTCHEFYTRTATKIGLEEVVFRKQYDFLAVSQKYHLRPGLISRSLSPSSFLSLSGTLD
jgi:hypothetical protein